ncbi:hypothetical protein GNF10_05220 [Nostoc sp. UCD121]|uniref:hypothetical protein n=1 Tax=unclassified Nostoc TaxID=2593658 RepID=UPI001626AECB|nr:MULTISPECIES: hypothetical protein [unclassified Nostoc]MBC1220868.1 hypothetical protein [Nostoc sp. UCD120]MBC1275396.1 hypothetical protein [Nostoc sp. UCD121]MBC1299187.1 hypothetical protein [Nostoc sp. UCD122]
MKKFTCLMIVGAVFSISAPAVAESRAVNINIGSIGGSLDNAALRTIRQVIGFAVGTSTVDKFIVYSPKSGSIPIEGGLSACAEAGFGTSNARFNAFIQELRSINPKPGTFYNVELTATCKPR